MDEILLKEYQDATIVALEYMKKNEKNEVFLQKFDFRKDVEFDFYGKKYRKQNVSIFLIRFGDYLIGFNIFFGNDKGSLIEFDKDSIKKTLELLNKNKILPDLEVFKEILILT